MCKLWLRRSVNVVIIEQNGGEMNDRKLNRVFRNAWRRERRERGGVVDDVGRVSMGGTQA